MSVEFGLDAFALVRILVEELDPSFAKVGVDERGVFSARRSDGPLDVCSVRLFGSGGDGLERGDGP